MSSSKFIDKICRICLGDKELFNWNKEIFEFSGISYKDCYYNYFQLDGNDSDFYPNKLCKLCGNELKIAHFLFERALESFYVLRNCINSKNRLTDYSDVEMCNEIHTVNQSVEFLEHFDSIDDMQVVHDSIIEDTENKDFEQILISNAKQIGLAQFEDIQKFESSVGDILPHQIIQRSSTETEEPITKNNEHINSTEKLSINNFSENSEEKGKSDSGTSDQNLMEQNEVISIQSVKTRKRCSKPPRENFADQKSRDDSELTTKQPVKIRKKYILICQYCSLEVDGSNQLKIHEATHDKNRERTHTCPKCGLKLYSQGSLNEHMKIHEENRQKKHKCEFCEKAFYNKGALNVHRRIHLGLMFKCPVCLKEYFRQIDLDKHLPTHSISPLRNNIVKKRYVVQCQHCDKKVFTNRLKEHMAIHAKQPQAKCKLCGKEFYSRRKCSNHLRRFHRRNKTEYDDFIHDLVDNKSRVSLLKIQQETKVQTIVK